MAKRPTAKMISFARNVIAGMTATDAVKESLYETDGMSQQAIYNFASELMRHPSIAAAIEKAQEEVLRGGRLIREDLESILENIAEANLGEFLNFESDVVTDSRGRVRRVLLLETKNSEELTVDQLACIQEISEGQNGKIRYKLKSASDAIKELNRMRGYHAPPKVPVGQDGKDVEIPVLAVVREVVTDVS